MSRLIGIVSAVIVFAVGVAGAQPLADRIPQDAIIYIGWAGADTLGEPYRGSNLRPIIEQSRIRELFTDFAPRAVRKLVEAEPEAEEPMRLLMTFGGTMWRYPTAMFAGIDLSNPEEPMPKIGILCRAGADSAKVHKEILGLLAQLGDSPVPVRSFELDDLVAVVIGYEDGEMALAGVAAGRPASLAGSAAFTETMKRVQSDPVLVTYIDVERLVAQVEAAVQQADDEEAKEIVPKVLDAFGLRGLKRIITTSAFDGKEWMSVGFVDAPAPRTGLLSILEPKPVSPELLKVIPADATFVATARFDLARLIREVRTAAGQVNPEAPRFINMGLGAVQMALARNPMTDILEPLGEDWAIYCSPSVNGNGVLGLVVVNRPDDPKKLTAALPTASVNFSNWLGIVLRQQKAEVELSGRMTKIGDQSVYYLGAPVIAPAWTMRDGYLYMGLFPQTAASGAMAAAAGGRSFDQNEKFLALRKRLGVDEPVSFSFYDLPSVAGQGNLYQQILMVARYGGFGDLFGLPMPEPLIPPLPVILENLSAAGSVAWVDDAGYHVRSISPFPGSKMLSEPGFFSSGGGPFTGAVMVSILLPSLNRARETANRVKCASNMRQIGMAMFLYATDNQGRFPDDLGQVVLTQDIVLDVFICPSGDSSLPHDLDTMTPEQMAEWVNEFSPYVYVGAGMDMRDADAERIVLYEIPTEHGFDGINALFGDGHVEFLLLPQARAALAAQGVDLDDARRRR